MANTVLSGDYSGLISFKGDKKGLLITENKFFGAKKTFINKTTVDHYELVMQEGNSSMGSGVAICSTAVYRGPAVQTRLGYGHSQSR